MPAHVPLRQQISVFDRVHQFSASQPASSLGLAMHVPRRSRCGGVFVKFIVGSVMMLARMRWLGCARLDCRSCRTELRDGIHDGRHRQPTDSVPRLHNREECAVIRERDQGDVRHTLAMLVGAHHVDLQGPWQVGDAVDLFRCVREGFVGQDVAMLHVQAFVRLLRQHIEVAIQLCECDGVDGIWNQVVSGAILLPERTHNAGVSVQSEIVLHDGQYCSFISCGCGGCCPCPW
mmetsp:Transcript_8955/g.24208  ORF Transcript_8955/g.24208 Transcript_8955/m.24208 type:complete len:233 (-) Transcript_8955:67-765(-)